MNKKMLFLSLLFVVVLFKVEFSRANESSEVSQEMIDKSLILRKKVDNTPEYRAMERFRQKTNGCRNGIARVRNFYEDRCRENGMFAYFSEDCRIARAMDRALKNIDTEDAELIKKAFSTPEYKEWEKQ